MRRLPDPAGAVLAICGLAFEARLVAGPGVRTLAGGGRAGLAGDIERQVDRGIAAIVSFGLAGALDAALRPGTLIVADAVVATDERYLTDPDWSRLLSARLPRAVAGSIAGVDRIVGDRLGKRALFEQTGAVAVDMESHVAARIATAHGLPFVALRAISDPLVRNLPPAAMIGMREDGRVAVAAVLRSIVRRPQQLPSLLRIAVETRRALGALGEGRRLLGSRLGYADLDQFLLDMV